MNLTLQFLKFCLFRVGAVFSTTPRWVLGVYVVIGYAVFIAVFRYYRRSVVVSIVAGVPIAAVCFVVLLIFTNYPPTPEEIEARKMFDEDLRIAVEYSKTYQLAKAEEKFARLESHCPYGTACLGDRNCRFRIEFRRHLVRFERSVSGRLDACSDYVAESAYQTAKTREHYWDDWLTFKFYPALVRWAQFEGERDLQHALAYIDAIQKDDYNAGFLAWAKAMAYVGAKNKKEALAQYAVVSDLGVPGYTEDMLLSVGEFYEALGEKMNALRAYDSLIGPPRTSARAAFAFARVCMELGKVDLGHKVVEQLLKENPDFPSAQSLKDRLSRELSSKRQR